MTYFNYFAYGSNMNADRMADRCPNAIPQGIARLDRHAVRIGHRGVATIVPDSKASTLGVLWSVTEPHVESLDRAEGVSLGLYRRQTVVVQRLDVTVEALTYVEKFRADGTPRAGYLEIILEGARDFEMPEEYLAVLGLLRNGIVGR